jgi:mono/diheme cytochrome c family protein
MVVALVALAALVLLVFWFARARSAPVVINETAVPPVPTLDATSVAQGESLYAQHCAQCHGANLEGAPEWKRPLSDGSLPPPPHDSSGHTWHHSDALLLSLILNGGDPAYNSKMPAFAGKLTEDEARMIVEFFKSRWGQDEREFQWWVTATRE